LQLFVGEGIVLIRLVWPSSGTCFGKLEMWCI